MQWYYDRIKDKSSELEKYPGYLPSIVRMAINLSNWYDFLKEKGLYEKTMDEIKEMIKTLDDDTMISIDFTSLGMEAEEGSHE